MMQNSGYSRNEGGERKEEDGSRRDILEVADMLGIRGSDDVEQLLRDGVDDLGGEHAGDTGDDDAEFHIREMQNRRDEDYENARRHFETKIALLPPHEGDTPPRVADALTKLMHQGIVYSKS